MAADRDRFVIEGGCWCDYNASIGPLRVMGHTEECTQARQGWAANYRHLGEMEKQRRIDEAAGRSLREDAERAINE